jgi:hypothetical protein
MINIMFICALPVFICTRAPWRRQTVDKTPTHVTCAMLKSSNESVCVCVKMIQLTCSPDLGRRKVRGQCIDADVTTLLQSAKVHQIHFQPVTFMLHDYERNPNHIMRFKNPTFPLTSYDVCTCKLHQSHNSYLCTALLTYKTYTTQT